MCKKCTCMQLCTHCTKKLHVVAVYIQKNQITQMVTSQLMKDMKLELHNYNINNASFLFSLCLGTIAKLVAWHKRAVSHRLFHFIIFFVRVCVFVAKVFFCMIPVCKIKIFTHRHLFLLTIFLFSLPWST